MFTIPVDTFLETTKSNEKNVNISMGVSLLENQNWYYRDHPGKGSIIMFWLR